MLSVLIFLVACSGPDKRSLHQREELLRRHPLLASDSSKKFGDLFELTNVIRLSTGDDHVLGDIIVFDIAGDRILVSDYRATKGVYLFDTTGAFLKRIGRTGRGPGEYLDPMIVCFNPEGGFYIYDRYQLRMDIYDSNDQYTRTVEVRKFFNRMKIDTSGNLFFFTWTVTDSRSWDATVFKYDKSVNFQTKFFPEPDVFSPAGGAWGGGIAIDSQNFLYGITSYEYKISVFNNDGKLVKSMVDPPGYYLPILKKATHDTQMDRNRLGSFHQSWSCIINLQLYDDSFLFVFVRHPVGSGEAEYYIDIYDVDGGVYKIGVKSPIPFTAVNAIVRGSNLYILQNGELEKNWDVSNPRILQYRLR
jgi:hypothetical protein